MSFSVETVKFTFEGATDSFSQANSALTCTCHDQVVFDGSLP